MSHSALVVDDEETIRMLIRRGLAVAGIHEVAEARDGYDALSQLQERSYCAVFLDLRMPRMSGYQLLEILRTNPPAGGAPRIIIASADRHAADHPAVQDDLVTKIIPKPFDMEVFIDLVKSCMLASHRCGSEP